MVELGVWLSGLESFFSSGHRSFLEGRDGSSVDASREFAILHSALERCSLMTSRILSSNGGMASAEMPVSGDINFGEMSRLGSELRDAVLLSTALVDSRALGAGQWKAWCSMLSSRLSALPAFAKLVRTAELEGDRFLPSPLLELTLKPDSLSDDHAELALVLPRFGRVLMWLSVIGRMLEADEPLKSAIVIFARVNEQVFELTSYINNRLERFADREAEVFATLDAASYTASIELKKVYSQELAGLAGLRPAPSIYARMETAYALLNEGFQQILAGFARLVDPDTNVFKLFPNFEVKRVQSMALRKELWGIVNLVQATEAQPEAKNIETMKAALIRFVEDTAKHLFYKDTETVERFVQEIVVTKENKDLVPILHRFGAYLEALFGQVNLRAVLAEHPFEK